MSTEPTAPVKIRVPEGGAPRKAALPGESKGVDYYAYLGTASTPFQVDFSWQSDGGDSSDSFDVPAVMYHPPTVEIQGTIFNPGKDYRFQWVASQGGTPLFTGSAYINPIDGDLEDGAGNLGVMLDTRSILSPGAYALSYGFYDAGSGIHDSLTDHDQSYVYLTPDVSNWMGDLLDAVPAIGNRPFASFSLPGAHDCGMCDASVLNTLVGSGDLLDALLEAVAGAFSIPLQELSKLVGPAAVNAMVNLSFTQKDDISTMLDLGIRYFDFRPGHFITPIVEILESSSSPPLAAMATTLYHQHTCIPGYAYPDFLDDVLSWLLAHPTEVVVVDLNVSGFMGKYSDAMQPTPDELDAVLAASLADTGAQGIINIGSRVDLYRTYANLLASNTRLIFLNQLQSAGQPVNYDSATKNDSYNDKSYHTTDPQSVIQALEEFLDADQSAYYDYTVLQVQATAEFGSNIAPAIVTLSQASSPILSTKAMFDNATYPWLYGNVPGHFPARKLAVLLNDFADNALTSFASEITAMRVQQRTFTVLAVGSDGNLWLNWLDPTAGWQSGWDSNPFGMKPGVPPFPGLSAFSELYLFGIDPEGVLWGTYTGEPPGGDWYANWASNPFGFAPGSPIATVATGTAANGDLQVFASATDGTLWFNYLQACTGWQSSWTANPFGWTGPAVVSMAMGQSANGDFQAFAVGADGSLWFNYLSRGGDWQPSWTTNPFGWQSDSAAAVWLGQASNGDLQVFVADSGGTLWHNSLNLEAGWQPSWTANPFGWTGPAVVSMAMGQSANGDFQTFAVGADGSLWFNCLARGGDWQSIWDSGPFGWQTGSTAVSVSLGQASNGDLEVFVVGSDGTLWLNALNLEAGWQPSWTANPFGLPSEAAITSIATISF